MIFFAVCFCTLLSSQFAGVLCRPQAPAPAPAAAVAAAAPAPHPQGSASPTPIPIISQTEVVGPDGSFNFSYESGNGIHFQQGGYVKKGPALAARTGELQEGEEDNNDIQVIQGSYSYTAPDGQVISLRYIADENGFQPEGDHLPTTPAIPDGIQSSLAQLKSNPEPEASQSQPEPAVRPVPQQVAQTVEPAPVEAAEPSSPAPEEPSPASEQPSPASEQPSAAPAEEQSSTVTPV